MKGLTAKVFRTYNASITFQEQLDVYTPKNGSVQEKLNAFNKANRMVAILCNHQKSVSKNHSTSMEKMNDKVCSGMLTGLYTGLIICLSAASVKV